MKEHWLTALVGLSSFGWHVYQLLSRFGLLGPKFHGGKMQLSKAFDPQPLITQLKAAGIADAEKLVNDSLPVLFDWLNTSVGMEVGAYAGLVTPMLALLEQKAQAAINTKI